MIFFSHTKITSVSSHFMANIHKQHHNKLRQVVFGNEIQSTKLVHPSVEVQYTSSNKSFVPYFTFISSKNNSRFRIETFSVLNKVQFPYF